MELTIPGLARTRLNSAVHRLAVGMRLAAPREASTLLRLSQPVRIPFGAFHFKFEAPEDSSYCIEASTDLRSWRQLSTGTGRAGLIDYIDSEAYQFSYRFYRLRSAALFSENVLGYAALTLAPGYSLIASPFQNSQTVNELFPKWPNGTALNWFDPTRFRLDHNRVEHDRWTNPHGRLAPGDGALFYNPTSEYKTISFVGQLTGGLHKVSLQPGCSIRSAPVPRPGTLDELGYPAANGDLIYLFDTEKQQYIVHTFENGSWTPAPPVVGVGEAFWVAKSNATTWSAELDLEVLSG